MSNSINPTSPYSKSNQTSTTKMVSSAKKLKNDSSGEIFNTLSPLQLSIKKAIAAAKEFNTDNAKIRAAAHDMFTEFQKHQTAIRFEFASDLNNEMIVKIVRRGSGQLVMQFPPEESLAIRRLAKELPGVLLDSTI